MKSIYLHNDYVEYTLPIRGRDPSDLKRKLYHSNSVVALITDEMGSDDPIGTLTTVAPEIDESGRYSIFFNAADIDSALGALDDGSVVYRVIKASDDWRVEDAFTVRHVRPSDVID